MLFSKNLSLIQFSEIIFLGNFFNDERFASNFLLFWSKFLKYPIVGDSMFSETTATVRFVGNCCVPYSSHLHTKNKHKLNEKSVANDRSIEQTDVLGVLFHWQQQRLQQRLRLRRRLRPSQLLSKRDIFKIILNQLKLFSCRRRQFRNCIRHSRNIKASLTRAF